MGWDQTVSLIVTILVAVLGGVLYNGVQFRQIYLGFKQVDRRFEQVDKRFDDVRRRIDDLRANTMARLGDLRSDMTANFVQVHQELSDLRTLLQSALQARGSLPVKDLPKIVRATPMRASQRRQRIRMTDIGPCTCCVSPHGVGTWSYRSVQQPRAL